jgi:hypothetical protein
MAATGNSWSIQIAVHLVARFQRKIFFLEINQSEKRIACGGHAL